MTQTIEDSRFLASSLPRFQLKVALVHDWLITLGGADRVLLALHEMFPQAPIYTALHDPRRLPDSFADLPVRTSWLQRVPRARARHRSLLPAMPFAFRSFDLRGYDVVLSSSHACAHGVRVPAGAVHVCYCHTPMRYAWDQQPTYLAALPAVARPAAQMALAALRAWDRAAAQRVDHYIANSQNVAARIRAHYGREATVIYPPVDTEFFTPARSAQSTQSRTLRVDRVDREDREDYYLVVSRLVPYKRVDLAVLACTQLGLPLVVVGDGPERARLDAMAGPTVRFAGEVDDDSLRGFYRGCRALIFPGEEDFGIVPVEAQSCGRPVIGFARGGLRETVVPGRTGTLFPAQSIESLRSALGAFDPGRFDPQAIRAHAGQFSRPRFQQAIAAFVERVVSRYHEST
jgi:glycosyltransferase involved in cell wall biosynthesis